MYISVFVGYTVYTCTKHDFDVLSVLKTLQPPKVPPNSTRLIVTSEDTLEFGKVLGSGAFGTVYEVTDNTSNFIFQLPTYYI